jgi:hypothetical protein
MRLVLERICPPRKDRPVAFAMPPLQSPADAVTATAALAEAVASGEITPLEAGELSKVIEGFTRAFELHDVDQRLKRLERGRV